MSRAAIASMHPTSFVSIEGPTAGRRALLDVPAAGASDPGLPVLLVPGFTGSKEDFTPILDGIAASGHRVLALDLAGQWESDGTSDPASYLPEVLSQDLPLVLAALGISRAHLIGHSYGGLVSRAAVLADASPWASLTLFCSGPGELQGSRRSATELLQAAAGGMELGPLYDGLLDYWASHGEALPQNEGAVFQRARFTTGKAAALVGMAMGLLGEPDRVEALRAVCQSAGIPVSVVYGENDDAWLPSEQDEMASRLGVTPIMIAGAGHSPAYEAPETTVQVLTALVAE